MASAECVTAYSKGTHTLDQSVGWLLNSMSMSRGRREQLDMADCMLPRGRRVQLDLADCMCERHVNKLVHIIKAAPMSLDI